MLRQVYPYTTNWADSLYTKSPDDAETAITKLENGVIKIKKPPESVLLNGSNISLNFIFATYHVKKLVINNPFIYRTHSKKFAKLTNSIIRIFKLMMTTNLRKLNVQEIPVMASFLAEIFINNGIYITIFPNLETRKKRLSWLFEKNLLLQRAEKNTWVLVPDDTLQITHIKDIVATVTFMPSAERKNTISDYVKQGLLAMPFRFGLSALINLLKANEVNERSIENIAMDDPYWYLCMVAVAPEHRRKGIAKQLINNVILTNNTEALHNSYKTILLTTQLESNVRLYSELGFTPMDSSTQNGYTNWVMKKV